MYFCPTNNLNFDFTFQPLKIGVMLLAVLASFFLGLSRGGLKGIAPIFILLMTAAYGAKAATGIIVPLLIIGDIFAVVHYKRFIQKRYVKAFLPYTILGLLIAVWVGSHLSEILFKRIIAVLILLSLGLMWLWDFYLKKAMAEYKWLNGFLGIGAGFFAMMGNFGGAFANIYFLMTRLPKKELIGTATLIFFILNVLKIPFHLFIWETIDIQSLKTDLLLVPFMIIGFFVGTKVIDYVSERWFRQFLYVVTILGALFVLIV